MQINLLVLLLLFSQVVVSAEIDYIRLEILASQKEQSIPKIRRISNRDIIQDDFYCENENTETYSAYREIFEIFSLKDPFQFINNAALDSSGQSNSKFQSFVGDLDLGYFEADEFTKPFEYESALECGYEHFVPPVCKWAPLAAIAVVVDSIREHIGSRVSVRNFWRPYCYNLSVDGAMDSDHVHARAVDIDFQSPQERAEAQKFICENLWSLKKLDLQIGIGCYSLHIGIESENKNRKVWAYDSYKHCEVKNLDGDDCFLAPQKYNYSSDNGPHAADWSGFYHEKLHW